MNAEDASVGRLEAEAALEWLVASPAALAAVAAGGELTWANPACATLLGLNADAAGHPLAKLLGLGEADAMMLLQALAAGGVLELPCHRAGLAPRWLAIEVRAAGAGMRVLALQALDRAKAAEREVERLSEQLALVRDAGRIVFWERDLNTGRGRWDRNYFRLLGMEGEGESPPWAEVLKHVHEADQEPSERLWSESLRRAGSYGGRFRLKAVDGRVRHLNSRWQVLDGPSGRPERVLGIVTDETEAWTLAHSYDELASQLALAVDLARIAIWHHDLATDHVHCNAQGWALLDMPPSAEGRPIGELRALVHPDDLAQVANSADAALESDQPADVEARYRRRDGGWRTLLTRRAVQRDAEGQPLALLGVALDITDRIDESRRAAELGRRFELATRTAGIGWWSLEGDAERAQWSDQLRELHGLAAGEPVPPLKDWLACFVHPADVDAVKRRFADWTRSGRRNLEFDFRIVQSSGQVRHLITHSRVEGGKNSPLLFGLVIDVTERQRVEMALRQASERAALAARGAGLGAWELDLRDGSGYWDEQMWRLRGLEPRAEPPSEEGRLAMVHPDDREATREANRMGRDDEPPPSREFRIVLPDGTVRWLASRSTLVRDEQGRPLRLIGVNWDITDRRTAEAERHEREIAQRENLAKSKFLARMSHELRTPLNAVLGFTQLLLHAPNEKDADVRHRRLQHIQSAGHHLLDLINDVLDLSSLEGGEVPIAQQPVPLAPLVAGTLPLLETLLREHRVHLRTGALEAVALGDATRLRQVLLNLLSNAVKYNRPGGHVTVDAARRGGNVILRVADTGRGMSDQQMRHLFEPFNRLGIERENIEGTGIGLAIVKALVERMGGSVHVDSTLGVGSLFELRLADGSALPATPPPADLVSRPLPLPESLPRGSLLYIEDNPVNAQIISELIARRTDLKLEVAPDGLSGVERALALRPDLVLLDMQLPDIDGHEVLRRLRAHPATTGIPVIALSANAMPEDIESALRAGLSDYWTKPLDFRVFMASIEQIFGPGPGNR
jgi:signal transduction histidine kinase/CheY-like chemotaxis protein